MESSKTVLFPFIMGQGDGEVPHRLVLFLRPSAAVSSTKRRRFWHYPGGIGAVNRKMAAFLRRNQPPRLFPPHFPALRPTSTHPSNRFSRRAPIFPEKTTPGSVGKGGAPLPRRPWEMIPLPAPVSAARVQCAPATSCRPPPGFHPFPLPQSVKGKRTERARKPRYFARCRVFPLKPCYNTPRPSRAYNAI